MSINLSPKTQAAFENWLESQDATPWIAFFYQLPDIIQHAYYTAWFDSVGIYIHTSNMITAVNTDFDYVVYQEGNSVSVKHDQGFEYRTEATQSAILAADKIFNKL